MPINDFDLITSVCSVSLSCENSLKLTVWMNIADALHGSEVETL